MNEEYANAVLRARGKEYGDYRQCVLTIKKLREKIQWNIYSSKDNGISYNNEFSINSEMRYLCEFMQTMLALKAARSIYSVGESYKDCLVDFINYIRLTKEAINDCIRERQMQIKFEGKTEFKILFDEKVFNPLLNKDYIQIESISCLLKEDWVKEWKKIIL